MTNTDSCIFFKLTSFILPFLPSSLPHLALCGPLFPPPPPLSSPLSLHHRSLPPSGVTARWLQVAREGGKMGGRDVEKDGWREGWKTGGGDELSSVPMLMPSQCRPTSCSVLCTVYLFTDLGGCILSPVIQTSR